jgi:hypothetical protein
MSRGGIYSLHLLGEKRQAEVKTSAETMLLFPEIIFVVPFRLFQAHARTIPKIKL